MNMFTPPSERRPVVFVVPGEPRGKGRPIFTVRGYRSVPDKKRGGMRQAPIVDAITDKKTVAYEKMVAQYASLAMRGRKILEGQCRIEVVAYFTITESWTKKQKAEALAGESPYVKRIDLDNIVKSISDAMNGVVFVDDCQVTAIAASKVYGEKDQVVVVVTPIAAWYTNLARRVAAAIAWISDKDVGVIPSDHREIITEALDYTRLNAEEPVRAGQDEPAL